MTAKDQTKLPKGVTSEVVDDSANGLTIISVSAPFTLLEAHYDKAFKQLAKSIKADGFRPGKVPADVAKKQIPEIMVLDQAGREVIADLYTPLFQKHQIDGIGEPQIRVTKLAKDNPFEFSISVAKVPTIDLKDYKKVRNELDKQPIDPVVDDKELDEAIAGLRHQWAQQQKYQDLTESDPEKAKTTDPRQIKVEDDDLPELTDEFVSQLGDYESVADFKTKFRANIKTNKAMQELDQRRAAGLTKIIEQAEFIVPQLVYDAELDRLFEMRKAEISQAGLTFNQYLKAIQKSESEMKKSMLEDAKNSVHSQMVIAEIAKNEDIKPDKKTIDAEVEHLSKMYPDANQKNLVAYVESQLTSRLVMQWLASRDEQDNKSSEEKAQKKSTKKSDSKDKKKSKKKDS